MSQVKTLAGVLVIGWLALWFVDYMGPGYATSSTSVPLDEPNRGPGWSTVPLQIRDEAERRFDQATSPQAWCDLHRWQATHLPGNAAAGC